ncbi:CHAD domain-containing protein [Chloroflexota bacterium]
MPDGYSFGELESELAPTHIFERERPFLEPLTLLDTFDWRLFDESLALYLCGNKLSLHLLPYDDILSTLTSVTQPVFIEDLPESSLKRQLAPVVEIRALLKRAEVQRKICSYRILNRDDKIVVRIFHEEVCFSAGNDQRPSAVHLRVKLVRGYPKHFRNLANHFAEAGCEYITEGDIYMQILGAAGAKPGDYSSKLEIKLEPYMRSDEAVKRILRFLLEVMEKNEPGIQADIDTEFLHDYRVAVRRARSALTQLKHVFPPEKTERYKNDFANLGETTNLLRDLDVYLLKEEAYKSMLPVVLRGDIAPMFAYLREKRSKSLMDVVNVLGSVEYGRIKKDWELFLKEPAAENHAAPYARWSIIDLAQERIYKRYRSVIRDGRLALQDPQEKQLHLLRIECKKLRYLIEFFADLFPPKKIAMVLKLLRRLQDNLGDFNDLCIQEQYLLEVSGELPVNEALSRSTLLAIGSLIGALDNKKQSAQASFSETFTEFSCLENRKLFRNLFAQKEREGSL